LLERYVGHFPNTSLLSGNIALAAHNRGFPNSWFERLHELEIGDEIIYSTRFSTMYFEVVRTKEVDERDMSVLDNTPDTRLTLITCITERRNKRLVVTATLIANESISLDNNYI